MTLLDDSSLDFVDWSNPVNWDHSLNRGLVEWFLAVPNTHGFNSKLWRGLCNRHVGTLNKAPGSYWKGDGFNKVGAANFDLSNSFNVGSVISSGDWTITAWVFTEPSGNPIMYVIGTGGRKGVFINFSGSNWGFFDESTTLTGSDPGQNSFGHLTLTKTSTSYALYLNGASDNSGTLADTDLVSVTIGNRASVSRPFQGKVSSVMIHNRVLTAAEIRHNYELTRSGFDGLLNTIELPNQSGTLESAFQPAWAARSTTIAGVAAGA